MTHTASIPSDMAWVDAIPAHWSRTRIKYVARRGRNNFIDGDWIEAPYITDQGIRLVQCGNVGTGVYEEQGFKYISEETFRQLNCTEVQPDDILICRLQSSRTILAGRACLAPDLGVKMITSVDNCIVKPSHDFDPRYVVYQLSVPAYLAFIEVVARGGTRDRISRSMLGGIQVVAPPLGEQQNIADFLDHKTALIDALIAKKQRMIDLLHEKRQALISEAVTKGLDPSVTMKDSGIEWLGKIPAHWEVVRLKFVASIQSGVTLGKRYPESELVSRPYLRVANVQDGYLDLSEITYIDIPQEEVGRHELQAGDVLMTEGGDFDKLGRGCVWPGEISGCLHQNHVFAVRPSKARLDPHFLTNLMTSHHGKNYFTSTSQQTTNLATTNRTKLGDFTLPLPSLKEQRDIIEHLKRLTRHLECIRTKIQGQIDKLRQYRQTLISAAVTGKIEVGREVA